MERSPPDRLPVQDGQLGDELHHRGRVLHHVLHVPCDICPPGAVRFPGRAERAAIQGDARSPAQEAEALPREPEVGMQEAEGFQLHHADADRRRHRVPPRRDTGGRRHDTPHHLQLGEGDPQLQYSQRTHPDHQLLHYRLVPDQLRHLLRHVTPIQGDLQRTLRARNRRHSKKWRIQSLLAR